MATPTIEEYLEAIYLMQGEGAPVIAARVADRMGVSAPTMTATLKRMISQGYVTVDERKEIALTEKGGEAAESLVRRHRLSERWLTDVLGLEWARAHQEACKLEHAISPEVVERLAKALNNPSTCPHGNPIPGAGQDADKSLTPLSLARQGDRVTIAMVSHIAEEDPRLLDYLEANGLVPGVDLEVVEVAPWAGVVTVSVAGSTASIGMQAAMQILVRSEV